MAVCSWKHHEGSAWNLGKQPLSYLELAVKSVVGSSYVMPETFNFPSKLYAFDGLVFERDARISVDFFFFFEVTQYGLEKPE